MDTKPAGPSERSTQKQKKNIFTVNWLYYFGRFGWPKKEQQKKTATKTKRRAATIKNKIIHTKKKKKQTQNSSVKQNSRPNPTDLEQVLEFAPFLYTSKARGFALRWEKMLLLTFDRSAVSIVKSFATKLLRSQLSTKLLLRISSRNLLGFTPALFIYFS